MALDKFPDLRVQESQPTFREVNDKLYIEIRCTVWRDKDDQLPCIAYCWEPFPGRTPYTKDSEQMNASTSALGRALGMMGFGIDHKMASKQEVMARQEQPRVEIARYDDGEPVRLPDLRFATGSLEPHEGYGHEPVGHDLRRVERPADRSVERH